VGIRSLEYETTVSSRGIAPAHAVIEELGAARCRLRTLVFFDTGDTIEFTYGPDAALVRGTVFSHTTNGARFVYDVGLDRMSAKEMDALARAVAPGGESLADHPGVAELLRRSAPRVSTRFDVIYRTPSVDASQALAVDVSTGGLMMSCGKLMVPGVPVELRFTLPPATEMTLGARIVSRQEVKKGTFLYGLAFMRLEDDHRKTLTGYVAAVNADRRASP
jgi:hypothetical protein